MDLGTILGQVEDWILALSGAAWVYPAMLGLALVDGFFPPLPSESVVITLAVAARTTGTPWLPGILVAAIVGAWCGDQIAYQIGRSVGTERVRILRTEKGRATVRWAKRALARRGASFIIAARYIPIGRVAVNMTAGAVRYPLRRFMGYSAIAAVVWGFYAIAVGLTASVWLHEYPLLAMAVGIAVGVVLGLLLDRVLHLLLHRRGELVDEEEDPADAPAVDGADPQVTTTRPSA
ncbi:DedA family protein [Xylanimonas protaetiae]|uniref:DedA family protein n=1 Tax=Xylanimonas protaetiae TaxID=2509457 RepID=A0A4P6F2Q3_9MICO|nr:DedA family protein [Xylanimonas protaetiae]QAY70120.1 DedA family protein [Xylanimonas protaetiae]